jgi:hypothetical protein
MHVHWTDQFITEALSTLTDKEQAALHLSLELPTNRTKPGVKRLTKFSFIDADEYETCLTSAKQRALEFFADRGIHHVSDLDFQQPAKSCDHRTATKVRNTAA